MADPEDSLIFDFKNRTATAKGRFAIVALLASATLLAGAAGYAGGSRLMEWALDRQETASIGK